MDAKGVLEFAAKNNAKILDLRFTDLPGVWQHVSFPIQELSENSFKEGFGFDASFVLTTIMAGVALTLNGMLAYWEDRGNFNN